MKRNLYKLAMASVGALALGINSPAMADLTSSHTSEASATVPESINVDVPSSITLVTSSDLETLSKTETTPVAVASNISTKKLKIAYGNVTLPIDEDESLYTVTASISVVPVGVGGDTVTASASGTADATDTYGVSTGNIQATAYNTGSITISIRKTANDSPIKAGAYTIPITVTTTT